MMLHANDAMGKAANEAAMVASLLDYRLLVASSPIKSREERAEALRKALVQWPSLCRAMADLERAAPNIAEQARTEAASISDFVEARRDAA